MPRACIILAVLLIVASVGSGIADARSMLNATKPFWQLNATRMLFASQAAKAGWPRIPILARVDLALYDGDSRRYVFVADNFTSLWSASEDALVAGAGDLARDAFVSHARQAAVWPLNGSATWVGTAVGHSQCLDSRTTAGACAGGASPSSLLFVSAGAAVSCVFHGRVGAVVLSCRRLAMTGVMPMYPSSALRGIAISGAPAAAEGAKSAVLVATTYGLVTLQSSSLYGFMSTLMTLYNATGSRVQNANVTWVGCLPESRYRRGGGGRGGAGAGVRGRAAHGPRKLASSSSGHWPNEYLGADCFAATSTQYCISNICPADLFLNIEAASAPNARIVSPHPFERIPGIVDARPTAGVFAPRSGEMFLGNDVCVNSMVASGALSRYGGFHGGLPVGGVLSGAWLNLSHAADAMARLGGGSDDEFAAMEDGVVIFGTKRGAIAKLPAGAESDLEGTWKLLLGGRWLPGGDDAAIQVGMRVARMATGGRSVLAVTDTGLSVIHAAVWRPVDKARYFEDVVAPRHQRSDGLFADVRLTRWGDAASAKPYATANDGLWTAMRCVSEAFRYVASRRTDQAALRNSWTAFGGLELLINVTGVRGLMGRSALRQDTCPGDQWIRSPTMPGWWFYSTASSDEVSGHMAAYATMHELIAVAPQEKARVARLLLDVVGHIVDHGLQLYDWNGKPTHWGHWEPAKLNDSPFWYDDRGVNSLQIMSWLSSAYRISGNVTFASTFESLRDIHGYARSMVNCKVTQPTDINFSDDELTFMAYLPLAFSGRPSAVMQTNPLFQSVASLAESSVTRTWRLVKRGKPGLWAALYAIFQPLFDVDQTRQHWREMDAAAAIIWDNIVTSPTDYVDWPVDNSGRLGAVWNPWDARNGQAHVVLESLYPLDELSMFQWNGDPFRARGGSGVDEASPVGFTFVMYAALAAPMLKLN